MSDNIHQQLLDAVRSYRISPLAVDLLNKYPPLIIAGTTAAGKETIIQTIEAAGSGSKVINHTTRPPRPGEQNGKDYWFVSEQEMLELLLSGFMIEVKLIHAQQISGFSISAYQTVLNGGHQPVVSIDVQGIEDIMKSVPSLKPIFVLPPSFQVWMERLSNRGHMSSIEREKRMRSAELELAEAMTNERFTLVVNRDIKATTREILAGRTDDVTQRRNRELAQQLLDQIRTYS